MALISNMRTIGKVGGVAATTAPYMRRLATDDDLRSDVTDFVRSANNLMTHVRSDRRLRKDVNRMIGSVQSGAGHLRSDVRPRHHYLRNFFIGTGLIIMAVGAGIALGWPRARQKVSRAVDQTTSRASSTVQDIREKVSGEGDARAA
jgi:hypothetical protein